MTAAVELPADVPDNYPALIERAAERFGDVVAVRDGELCWTFAELATEVDRCAAALVASGIEAGDAVGLWAPNAAEWLVAAMGTLRAGAVIVPVNTRFVGREAAYVLAKAKAKLLFTVVGFLGYDYLAQLREAEAEGERVPSLGEVVVLRGDTPDGTVGFGEFCERATPAAAAEAAARADRLSGDDTGLVMFTSGTTGLPKGVMVSQAPIIRNFTFYGSQLGMRTGDVMLVINPYFHAFGFCGAITPCLVFGATNLPHPVFDPTEVLRRIERERVTVIPGPPAIFQALLNHAELASFDVSSLRGAVTGAANVPVETVVAMRERLGFEMVLTAFGMTETHGLASICRADDPPELVARTSGKAVPDVELRVVDDAGVDVEVGEAGELLVRGYCVMKGYLDAPEQTAETITPDGWLHTGDVAVMDADGYIDITDRKKDMFINGGFNVYPAEVERVMIEHPLIGQVAVVGVPDERLGEVGAAFIVAAPEGVPATDELHDWCRSQMANYKVPRHYWIVDELPLNPSNKVLKADLRSQAATRLT